MKKSSSPCSLEGRNKSFTTSHMSTITSRAKTLESPIPSLSMHRGVQSRPNTATSGSPGVILQGKERSCSGFSRSFSLSNTGFESVRSSGSFRNFTSRNQSPGYEERPVSSRKVFAEEDLNLAEIILGSDNLSTATDSWIENYEMDAVRYDVTTFVKLKLLEMKEITANQNSPNSIKTAVAFDLLSRLSRGFSNPALVQELISTIADSIYLPDNPCISFAETINRNTYFLEFRKVRTKQEAHNTTLAKLNKEISILKFALRKAYSTLDEIPIKTARTSFLAWKLYSRTRSLLRKSIIAHSDTLHRERHQKIAFNQWRFWVQETLLTRQYAETNDIQQQLVDSNSMFEDERSKFEVLNAKFKQLKTEMDFLLLQQKDRQSRANEATKSPLSDNSTVIPSVNEIEGLSLDVSNLSVEIPLVKENQSLSIVPRFSEKVDPKVLFIAADIEDIDYNSENDSEIQIKEKLYASNVKLKHNLLKSKEIFTTYLSHSMHARLTSFVDDLIRVKFRLQFMLGDQIDFQSWLKSNDVEIVPDLFPSKSLLHRICNNVKSVQDHSFNVKIPSLSFGVKLDLPNAIFNLISCLDTSCTSAQLQVESTTVPPTPSNGGYKTPRSSATPRSGFGSARKFVSSLQSPTMKTPDYQFQRNTSVASVPVPNNNVGCQPPGGNCYSIFDEPHFGYTESSLVGKQKSVVVKADLNLNLDAPFPILQLPASPKEPKESNEFLNNQRTDLNNRKGVSFNVETSHNSPRVSVFNISSKQKLSFNGDNYTEILDSVEDLSWITFHDLNVLPPQRSLTLIALLKWANFRISKVDSSKKIVNIATDLKDGLLLCILIKSFSSDFLENTPDIYKLGSPELVKLAVVGLDRLGVNVAPVITEKNIQSGHSKMMFVFLARLLSLDLVGLLRYRPKPLQELEKNVSSLLLTILHYVSEGSDRVLNFDTLDTLLKLVPRIHDNLAMHSRAMQRLENSIFIMSSKCLQNSSAALPNFSTQVETLSYSEFIFDVAHDRLTDICVSSVYSELHDCIRKYNLDLQRLFQFYSASGTGSVTSMSYPEFMLFISDAKIVAYDQEKVKLKLGDIESLFNVAKRKVASDINIIAETNPAAELNPSEFCEALIRISAVRFEGNSLHTAFYQLMDQFILRNTCHVDRSQFAKLMAEPEMVKLLIEFQEALLSIFAFYSSGNTLGVLSPVKLKKGGSINTISFEEFHMLLKDCQIISPQFPLSNVESMLTYIHSQTFDQSSLRSNFSVESIGLIFPQFNDAICSLALMKNSNPFVPMETRITNFLVNDIFPPLSGSMKLKRNVAK